MGGGENTKDFVGKKQEDRGGASYRWLALSMANIHLGIVCVLGAVSALPYEEEVVL
jgi:hypothetical protein